MPLNGPDPNDSIRKFSTTVTVYPSAGSGTVGDSIYGSDDFGPPHEITARIRAADSPSFSMGDLGEPSADGTRLHCIVPASDADAISADDSIDFEGESWRVVEREPAPYNDFERFRLVPDPRRSAGSRS